MFIIHARRAGLRGLAELKSRGGRNGRAATCQTGDYKLPTPWGGAGEQSAGGAGDRCDGPEAGKRAYEYDSQLVWTGNAEHTSFDVPIVSLHEHKRIDPRSIIEAVRRHGEDMRQLPEGEDVGKWQVEVHGFDYLNTRSGGPESGGSDHIAVWMLDPDYDGRSLFPEQVFFPMAGARDGWARLARNLKAEIDRDLIEAYRGTKSLPFEAGEHGRVAVKIVDDRGIESLKVVALE